MSEHQEIFPSSELNPEIGSRRNALDNDGWRDLSLGEICDLINGRGFKPHEWRKQGLPIIRIQNLNGSDEFNYYDGDFDPKILVESGQLLFAWSGSRGASFGPHVWVGPTGVLNYHTWRVVPRDGTDRDYLNYLLEFETENIEASSHGASALVHVQKQDMEKRVFHVPPLPEQRAIAQVLSIWHDAIKNSEELCALKRERRDMLRSYLIAEADKDGEHCNFGAFLTESREPGTDGATARKISVKLYGRGAVEKKEVRGGSANTRYYKRRSGQVIYSKLDFLNGAFAVIQKELDGFESTLDLPAFNVSELANPRWVIEYLTRRAYYEQQGHLARGQRKARRVSPEDFLGAPIKLPARTVQDEIVAILSEADREIALELRLAKRLREQKRGLMQKLLTGEWRVQREAAVA